MRVVVRGGVDWVRIGRKDARIYHRPIRRGSKRKRRVESNQREMEGRLRGKIQSSTKEKGRREKGGKGVPRMKSGGCEK
jgi:hypothetical protein